MKGVGTIRRRVRSALGPRPRSKVDPSLIELTAEDRRYLESAYDDTVALPDEATEVLRATNTRLQQLRATYAALDLPVTAPSRWSEGAIAASLDLRYFRGETLFVWHYRELPRISELKYFVLLRYLEERDTGRLLERLHEDGAFGCWTFAFPGRAPVSRDLLDSVNEITFLERTLELSRRDRLSVLDIGAGYGRLAHRMTAALPSIDDYCCVDAVPESTFLSEYYLEHRGLVPPARVVPLDRLSELEPGAFDLAVNIHSFSECPLDAVAWWIGQLARLRVKHFLLIPNEPDRLLSLEPDGSRRDYAPLLQQAGFRLTTQEPVLDDEAVRALVRLEDRFFLFERAE